MADTKTTIDNDRLARIMRDTIYDEPSKEETWANIWKYWHRDAKKFVEKLDQEGFVIVPKSKVSTDAPPADSKDTKRER